MMRRHGKNGENDNMRQSESINELATALAKAQGQMGAAIKGAENPFFKSSYADLGSVIKAIKEPFAANGLSYVQFPICQDNTAGLVTRLMHSSGQWLEQDYTLPVGKFDAQGVGSAITYARRYALQAIAGIPAGDDDGNAASSPGIPEEEVQKCYDRAVQLLATGSPADFQQFASTVDPELQTMAFNKAPKGKISAFKKAWSARVNEFWKPIKAAASQLPDLVAEQSVSGVQEILEEFEDPREREALMGAIDEVSKAFIESMEAA